MQMFSKALDEIRAEEAKRLVRDGYEPVLKKSRWCFLKRPGTDDKETVKLSEIVKYNLRTVRAYFHREEFQRLWEYSSAGGPGSSWTSGRGVIDRGWTSRSPQYSESSDADPELVPGSRAGLGGGC